MGAGAGSAAEINEDYLCDRIYQPKEHMRFLSGYPMKITKHLGLV